MRYEGSLSDLQLDAAAVEPVILVDLTEGDDCLNDTLYYCRDLAKTAGVVLLINPLQTETACKAAAEGAIDFITAPFSDAEILIRVGRCRQWLALRSETDHLRRRLALDFGFDNFIGVSDGAEECRAAAARAADSDLPVYLAGENGCGKEFLAKIIHLHSSRRQGPFVAYDCAGADPEWVEADLFGAGQSIVPSPPPQPTVLSNAGTGTLYLKNFASLPLPIQNRILVSTEHNTGADIRIIASSPAPVAEEGSDDQTTHQGGFGFTIDLPPLRQRSEDIPALVQYFLFRLSASHREPLKITPDALRLLLKHPWPGNIRELENTLKVAAALAVAGRIDAAQIIFMPSEPTTSSGVLEEKATGSLEEVQKQQILRSLQENGWNYSQAAQKLGIGRTTLWRKIRKYNLRERPSL